MRSRGNARSEMDRPRIGAGKGVVGRHRIVPGGSSNRSLARASSRIKAARVRSESEIRDARARLRATPYCMRGLKRSSQGANVRNDSLDCRVRCASFHTDRPWGASVSFRRVPTIAANRSTIGANASATAGSANPNASVATSSVWGRVVGVCSLNRASPTRAKTLGSRAIQPTVSDVGACAQMPVKSSRPCVGRMPYSPQKLDGTRTDPPVSVPKAKSHIPAAAADADPDDDPPGTRSGAAGFRGVPVNGFSPSMPNETSSVAVLPFIEAPAASRRSTTQACWRGRGCARSQSGLPPPVGQPAMSIRSLTAKCRPDSGPSDAPAMRQRGPGTKAFRSSSVIAGVPSSACGLLCLLDYNA